MEPGEPLSIAVVGAGSWGTALAALAARSGHRTVLWARDPLLCDQISKTRTNNTYLPGVELPKGLEVSSDLQSLSGQELFLLAVPSFALRATAREIRGVLGSRSHEKIWISLTKGVEYDAAGSSVRTMSELISVELGGRQIYALSGPSFAIEVAQGAPTSAVLAGQDQKLAEQLQSSLSTDRFRIYVSDDLRGVELGGTFKNVIALAAGISDGLGFGDNAKGALIARGLVEMTRLGVHLGAKKETFFGLAGLGDMVITAMSKKSRNHAVGERIGRGEPFDSILAGMEMVAEGVYAAKAFHQLSQDRGIDLPITRAVYETLYNGTHPLEKLTELMTREPKREVI